VDVVLDREQHLVIQPDLLFISQRRLGIVRDRIWGAPDLIIEVLAPRPRIGDVHERLGWCDRYGIRECWLLHLDQSCLDVIAFGGGRELSRRRFTDADPIKSAVLSGFGLPLASILSDYR
jgi:Uma2 family endonuclease